LWVVIAVYWAVLGPHLCDMHRISRGIDSVAIGSSSNRTHSNSGPASLSSVINDPHQAPSLKLSRPRSSLSSSCCVFATVPCCSCVWVAVYPLILIGWHFHLIGQATRFDWLTPHTGTAQLFLVHPLLFITTPLLRHLLRQMNSNYSSSAHHGAPYQHSSSSSSSMQSSSPHSIQRPPGSSAPSSMKLAQNYGHLSKFQGDKQDQVIPPLIPSSSLPSPFLLF
jgi:hypothetical protein